MAKWRIDMLTPQEIAKYRQRSFDAINGIEYLLKYANVIAQYEKISDKYKTIAEYIGLGQEGGNSFYNYFIPLNADIVFLLRNSNHNTTNPYLYNRHEQLGRPNKRYIVYFKNGNTFSDNPITLLDAEHHSISYDVNALDNETSVIAYLNSLKGLFENGETTFQPLPITYDNGYVGDGCPEGNEFVEKLELTKRDIVDFFRHPDVGGAARVWDNVGF